LARKNQQIRATIPAPRSGSERPAPGWQAVPSLARRYRVELWVGLILVVSTLVVYSRCLRLGFVNYDDDLYVTANPHVLEGLTWANLGWAWTTFHATNWHPLTWMSLQFDATVFGVEAWGFHLSNVLLHAVSTLLLFLALRRMTGADGRSACVAALFALHPLHVESVAWVAERKDVLSTCFGMAALLAYARYAEKPGWGRYAVVAVLFALSLLAKPMLVTLPFLLLLLDWWPLRRLEQGVSVRWLVLEKLPLLVLCAGSSVATWLAQREGGAMSTLDEFPFDIRLANALAAYLHYVAKMLVPMRLAAFYPHPGWDFPLWQPIVAGVLLVAVTITVVRHGRESPYLPVGWLWYLGTLVPVLGLVQVGQQGMADRFTYFPMIGLFVLATWGAADLAIRYRCESAMASIVMVLFLALMLLSWFQIGTWQNSVTLWQHTLKSTSRNAVAHHNLGQAYLALGRPGEAAAQFQAAVNINPGDIRSLNQLATICINTRRYDEAQRYLDDALAMAPENALLHGNQGTLYFRTNRDALALEHYLLAVKYDPRNALAHYSLGNYYLAKGDLAKAADYFRTTTQLEPRDAEAFFQLGKVLGPLQQLDEAVACLQRAAELQPKVARYHYTLGYFLDHQKNSDAASAAIQKSLDIDRSWPTRLAAEAWRLATSENEKQRNGTIALEYAQLACRGTDRMVPRFLDILAAAYAEAGRFDEAVATAQQAAHLARENRDDKLAGEVHARLQLYEKSEPYREKPLPKKP